MLALRPLHLENMDVMVKIRYWGQVRGADTASWIEQPGKKNSEKIMVPCPLHLAGNVCVIRVVYRAQVRGTSQPARTTVKAQHLGPM